MLYMDCQLSHMQPTLVLLRHSNQCCDKDCLDTRQERNHIIPDSPAEQSLLTAVKTAWSLIEVGGSLMCSPVPPEESRLSSNFTRFQVAISMAGYWPQLILTAGSDSQIAVCRLSPV